MSALLTPPLETPRSDQRRNSSSTPSSAIARQAKQPRWRDTRLLVGVLLILVSVVVGARFIASATRTAQWLSVTRSLPAGHVLIASDLVLVKAHLPSTAGQRYFTADPGQLVGRTLDRALAAGELLPADALAAHSGAASRVLPVVVKAGRLPALSVGDHVDIYVLTRPAGGAAGREIRVLSDVEFIGQESLSSGDTSVQLRVAPQDAITAVAASQTSRVDVVRIDPDATNGPGTAGPSSIPAFDGS